MIEDTKKCLEGLVLHLSQRQTLCDLVDDKSQSEIEALRAVWILSEQLCKRMEELHKGL